MTRGPTIALWILATVLLSAATALLVSRAGAPSPAHPEDPHGHGSEHDFHRWTHEQLKLRPDQEQRLAPVERAFESERERLRNEIREAGHELAAAVRGGDPESAAIREALTRLNHAQGELQRVTLDHFFAMKEHLDPAQAEQLLEWTHDSIVPD